MSKEILDQTPREEFELINKRIRIWDEYDRATRNASELNELAKQISLTGNSEPFSALTPQNTPPTELAQAVSEVQKELQKIAAAKQTIQNNEEEIQRIKSQQMMMALGALAVIIIIVLVLVL